MVIHSEKRKKGVVLVSGKVFAEIGAAAVYAQLRARFKQRVTRTDPKAKMDELLSDPSAMKSSGASDRETGLLGHLFLILKAENPDLEARCVALKPTQCPPNMNGLLFDLRKNSHGVWCVDIVQFYRYLILAQLFEKTDDIEALLNMCSHVIRSIEQKQNFERYSAIQQAQKEDASDVTSADEPPELVEAHAIAV
jgi:hypothetical protein